MPADTANTAHMDFIVIFGFMIFSIIFALFVYFMSFILRRATKNSAPETIDKPEFLPDKDDDIAFQPDFFRYALYFLFFEALCALLLPFALVAKTLDIFLILEIMIFILTMIFATLQISKSEMLR